MERLTEHHVNKTLGAYMVCSKDCIDDNFDCNSCKKLEEMVDRLAAYEDTGLEPCDYSAMRAAINQVQEFKKQLSDVVNILAFSDIEHLKDIFKAEKDGRLVVLPCKVGDTVWTNIAIVGDRYKASDRPYPVDVVFIGIGGNGGFFHAQYTNGRISLFDFDKIGKTVFLTREEAEAALKKMEEADNEAD